MKAIEDIFIQTLEENNLLRKRDKLILGVSGGPDSLFMLHQFYCLKDHYKLHLVCAHFNHSLRPEADAEEQFVLKICKKLGIALVSEKKDVRSFSGGDSLEQTARNLRFDFFLKCSRQLKIKKIALAHHKDDLVETVLMRLIRGSGLKGLQGFLPRSRYRSLTVIRPLIALRKKDILTWLKKENIEYCVDQSNFQETFLRNRIRLKVMPLLEELNPNVVETLYNAARSIALDYDYMHALAYRTFLDLKKKETKNQIWLDLKKLKILPLALFNNVLRIAIEQLQGHTRRLELKHIKEVYDLVHSRPALSVVDLPSLLAKKVEKALIIQSLLL